jgi:hypothetical protein
MLLMENSDASIVKSFSSKPGARCSLLKQLHLAIVAELTPRKRKLYEHVWNRESVLCKLKRKYKQIS